VGGDSFGKAVPMKLKHRGGEEGSEGKGGEFEKGAREKRNPSLLGVPFKRLERPK